MTLGSLGPIWTHPRRTIHNLGETQSLLSQFGFTLGLSLIYLLLVALFFWVANAPPSLDKILTMKGLWIISFFYFLFVLGTYALLSTTAFFIWQMAKVFTSVATFSKTRVALLWGSLCSLPAPIFCLLFLYALEKQNNLMLEWIFFLCTIAASVYGLILALKMLSELLKVKLWQAFILLILGLPLSIATIAFTLIGLLKLGKIGT